MSQPNPLEFLRQYREPGYGTWIRMITWSGLAGGAAFLVVHETSVRLGYFWAVTGSISLFIALVQALRLGRMPPEK